MAQNYSYIGWYDILVMGKSTERGDHVCESLVLGEDHAVCGWD